MPSPWICSQLGAREHYAIPRALQADGRLERFYTDVWARGPWQLARVLGEPGAALAGRYHAELAPAPVRAFPTGGIPWIRQVRRTTGPERWEVFLRQFSWFTEEVTRSILRGARSPDVFFSYTGTFLETARALRERGDRCRLILGQVDPARTEEAIVAREQERWPGWEPRETPPPPEFDVRRRQEWEMADLVVVNSNWSRNALLEQDVPGSKLRVIPLVYEPPPSSPPPSPAKPHAGITEVLWLGQVILRKGIAYLLEAARLLADEPVRITIAGEIKISEEAVASAPDNVRFLGQIPRASVNQLYRMSDLFVLPTLSDGFAITQLEAMSHGLPVIATPCCGEVVKDGVNGALVPPANAEALAQTIAAIASDPGRRAALSTAALATSREFNLPRLSRALADLATPDA